MGTSNDHDARAVADLTLVELRETLRDAVSEVAASALRKELEVHREQMAKLHSANLRLQLAAGVIGRTSVHVDRLRSAIGDLETLIIEAGNDGGVGWDVVVADAQQLLARGRESLRQYEVLVQKNHEAKLQQAREAELQQQRAAELQRRGGRGLGR